MNLQQVCLLCSVVLSLAGPALTLEMTIDGKLGTNRFDYTPTGLALGSSLALTFQVQSAGEYSLVLSANENDWSRDTYEINMGQKCFIREEVADTTNDDDNWSWCNYMDASTSYTFHLTFEPLGNSRRFWLWRRDPPYSIFNLIKYFHLDAYEINYLAIGSWTSSTWNLNMDATYTSQTFALQWVARPNTAEQYAYSPRPSSYALFTFDEARLICQGEGGDLASITSQAALDFVKNNVAPAEYRAVTCPDASISDFYFRIGLRTVLESSTDANAYWWVDGADYNQWVRNNWKEYNPSASRPTAVLMMCHGLFTWTSETETAHARFMCKREPVAGGWGCWTSWSTCSGTCGYGQRSRTRECNNPAPSGGGAPCAGLATEALLCSTLGWGLVKLQSSELGIAMNTQTVYETGYAKHAACQDRCRSLYNCNSVAVSETDSTCLLYTTTGEALQSIVDGLTNTDQEFNDLVSVYFRVCKGLREETWQVDLEDLEESQLDFSHCGLSAYAAAEIKGFIGDKDLVIRRFSFDLDELPGIIGTEFFSTITVYTQLLTIDADTDLSPIPSPLTIYAMNIHYPALASGQYPSITKNGITSKLTSSDYMIDQVYTDCQANVPLKHLFSLQVQLDVYFVSVTGITEQLFTGDRQASTRRSLALDEMFVQMSLTCASILHSRREPLLLARHVTRFIGLLVHGYTTSGSMDWQTALAVKDEWAQVNSVVLLDSQTSVLPALVPESLLRILQADSQVAAHIAVTETILNAQNNIVTKIDLLKAEIQQNHRQYLEQQIEIERTRQRLERTKRGQLFNKMTTAKDEMGRLKELFNTSISDIEEESENFKAGIETYKKKMIARGILSLLESIGNLADWVNQAASTSGSSRRRRSYPNQPLVREGREYRHVDRVDGTIEKRNISSGTDADEHHLAKERQRRFIVLTILAVIGATAGIAAACVDIHDAAEGYQTAQDALDTMTEKLTNIDLEKINSEVAFRVIRDETAAIISGGVLDFGGAPTYRAAVMRMTNYGEAFVAEGKKLKSLLTQLTVSDLILQQSENLETMYNEWLSSIGPNETPTDQVTYEMTQQHNIFAFRLQARIINTYIEYCHSRFYYIFQTCTDHPTFSDTLTQMFSLVATTTRNSIRDHDFFEENRPTGIVMSYVLKDKEVGCREVDGFDIECPVSMLKAAQKTHFKIPVAAPVFSQYDRVRLCEMRIYLRGLQQSSGLVQLNYGHYSWIRDKFNGEEYRFLARERDYTFTYDVADDTTRHSTCSTSSSRLIQSTPFTRWYIRLASPNDVNLSGVTAIEVYILARGVSNGGGELVPDDPDLEFKDAGTNQLSRFCTCNI